MKRIFYFFPTLLILVFFISKSFASRDIYISPGITGQINLLSGASGNTGSAPSIISSVNISQSTALPIFSFSSGGSEHSRTIGAKLADITHREAEILRRDPHWNPPRVYTFDDRLRRASEKEAELNRIDEEHMRIERKREEKREAEREEKHRNDQKQKDFQKKILQENLKFIKDLNPQAFKQFKKEKIYWQKEHLRKKEILKQLRREYGSVARKLNEIRSQLADDDYLKECYQEAQEVLKSGLDDLSRAAQYMNLPVEHFFNETISNVRSKIEISQNLCKLSQNDRNHHFKVMHTSKPEENKNNFEKNLELIKLRKKLKRKELHQQQLLKAELKNKETAQKLRQAFINSLGKEQINLIESIEKNHQELSREHRKIIRDFQKSSIHQHFSEDAIELIDQQLDYTEHLSQQSIILAEKESQNSSTIQFISDYALEVSHSIYEFTHGVSIGFYQGFYDAAQTAEIIFSNPHLLKNIPIKIMNTITNPDEFIEHTKEAFRDYALALLSGTPHEKGEAAGNLTANVMMALAGGNASMATKETLTTLVHQGMKSKAFSKLGPQIAKAARNHPILQSEIGAIHESVRGEAASSSKGAHVKKSGHVDSSYDVKHQVGKNAEPNVKGVAAKKVVDAAGIRTLNPSEIRFSQSSINDARSLTESMRSNGWMGEPIDLVRNNDGSYITVDNSRVLAASQANIQVQARIHEVSEALPLEFVTRFTTRGGVPKTWGDAIRLRIERQNTIWRNQYPNGSPITGNRNE